MGWWLKPTRGFLNLNIDTLIFDYFNLWTILILPQSEETFSWKRICGCRRWCECLIYRTREKFHVYAQVNSAMQIQLEETKFAKANIEEIWQYYINSWGLHNYSKCNRNVNLRWFQVHGSVFRHDQLITHHHLLQASCQLTERALKSVWLSKQSYFWTESQLVSKAVKVIKVVMSVPAIKLRSKGLFPWPKSY